ncbi:hypothetical protein H8A95_15745 [Bradyrhizobium sp. Pear76]|uniref:hypothetical protein n=1 Tax=Bradyrhizobium oropedii TaxID=1571201 RepID=UPI001E62F583|nr:hypothetical protein [Bradyrhizobium oropedii]MCC8963723.1 hypothetical protein [Bradyrhizobium oropedii]
MANDFRCLSRCRSPLACAGFGYCRERNQDGCPMDDANIERRRQENARDELLRAGRAS